MDGVVGFGKLHVGECGELAYGLGDVGREGEEVCLVHVAGLDGAAVEGRHGAAEGCGAGEGHEVLYLGDTEGCEGAVDGGNAGGAEAAYAALMAESGG